jgi:hypothetical protein
LGLANRERAAGFSPVVRVIFPLCNYHAEKLDFGKVGAKKVEKVFEPGKKRSKKRLSGENPGRREVEI